MQKKLNYKSILNLTSGFLGGYQLNDYFNFLNNSIISLVPNGAVIKESFRYFDSFKANCVVISTLPINSTPKGVAEYIIYIYIIKNKIKN